MKRSLILPLVSGIFLLFATQHVMSRQKPIEQASPPIEPSRSPFNRQVAGSGIVEAQTENIKIGSPLAGIVERVDVAVGDTVKPDAPLFQLDTRQVEADLRAGAARLAAAESELARIASMPRPEDVPPVEAQRREAEAQVAEMRDMFQRTTRLFEKKVSTEEEMTSRRARLDVAMAQLDRMKAEEARLKAGAWDAEKKVSKAAVERARAELEQSRTERDRHTILTPHMKDPDGEPAEFVVLQVNVRPGEAVASASSTALIVLGNIRRKNVRVDIDEHDIPRFNPEAEAIAIVRGDAREQYPLQFVRIEPYVIPKRSLTGDNTERVDTRVLQVLYRIDESGRSPIYVGQQMDVFLKASDRTASKATAGR